MGALSVEDGVPVVDETKCGWCGDCADACPTEARTLSGTAMTDTRVLEAIDAERQSIDEAFGGVTVSGGEPLLQPEFLCRLLEGCGERGLHRVVDTSGYAPADVVRSVAVLTDLFLYDLKHLDEEAHRRATGVSNRTILENLALLAELHANVVVRFPLVPGVNDDDAHVRRLGEFVASSGWPTIEVVPAVTPTTTPFRAIDRVYVPEEIPAIDDETVSRTLELLGGCGLDARLVARG